MNDDRLYELTLSAEDHESRVFGELPTEVRDDYRDTIWLRRRGHRPTRHQRKIVGVVIKHLSPAVR